MTKHSSQIDYILINCRWKNPILDSNSYRDAKTGNLHESDQAMLRAKIRQLAKNDIPQDPSTSQTNSETERKFYIELLKHLNIKIFLEQQMNPDPN